jgi:ATP-dependent Clp protease adaptor protein ClpS
LGRRGVWRLAVVRGQTHIGTAAVRDAVLFPGAAFRVYRKLQATIETISIRTMSNLFSHVEKSAAPAGTDATLPRMSGDQGGGQGDGDQGRGGAPTTSVITKVKPKVKRPNLYRVLILNDDYTPMEFVVHVLERFFQKDAEAATKIMLHVHHHGIGECGVFTYEIAETKVTQVMDFARKHQHPLQCVMEKK